MFPRQPGDSRSQVETLPTPLPPAESDLRPPPVRRGFVLRRDLVETLKTTDAEVITLIAPTGYGKTTTLAQWARVETSPLAWLSLRREVNTAKSLLSHLAASLRRARVLTAEDVAFFQFMSDSAAAVEGAHHLARLLEKRASGPLVAIIDNVDHLKNRAGLDVVAELVQQLEGLVRVAVASHSTPKIGLPAVRATGRLLEITDERLAFGIEEVERLTTEVGLDPKIAPEIMASADGWPAATFLTVIAAKDSRPDLAKARVESKRNIHSFVESEILPRLSKPRRRFLTLMSPLEQMSGPLCDAVAHAKNSQRLLDSLERETHLIHHLDHDDTWFAMNPVLRQVLRADLENTEPDTTGGVHSSAAAWYEENGMPVEAIGHALDAEDVELFSRLMERLIKDHYVSGRVSDVLRWMAWLEETVSLDDFPTLAAIGALVYVQEGDAVATARWLDAASRGPVDRDTRSVILLVQACTTRTGVDQMLRDIEEAAETAGPGSRWLPAILVVKGLAHLMKGDIDQAEASYIEAAGAGLENNSLSSVILALGQRALIAIGRQEWDLAQKLSDQAVAIIDENGLDGYHTSALPLIAAARCARRDGDIARAQRLLTRAGQVRPRLSVALPGEGVQILLEMARAHIELSDVAGTRPLIREAEEIVLQRPDLGVLPAEVSAVKETLAGLGPGTVGLPALTKAELRLLPLLATHMSFPEIGDQLFVSRHTIKSQATSIYRKLGSSTRSEAIAKAYEIGLLSR